jgi:putative peptidoglycan lipid II flippase
MSKSILHSSRLISLVTLASRFTGLFRDMLIYSWLGNNWVQDRLNYAFLVPNIFRQLLGEGALSAAFIPVLTEKLQKEDKSAVGKLVGNVATILTLLLTILTLVVIIIYGVYWWFSSRNEYAALTAGLTVVMVPYMIFVCIVALFSGLLNCLDHFGLPAFMPVIVNMAQVVGVVIAKFGLEKTGMAQHHQVYIIGVTILIAGVIQLFWITHTVKKLGIRWQLDFTINNPDLRRIILTMLPMIFGLGILQFSTFMDNQIMLSLSATEKPYFTILGHQINYPLQEGALSAVNLARRLYNFPLGVLGIALATAAFPAFSRLSANNDHKGLADMVSKSLRLAIFEGLSTGIGLIVLSPLIIKVLMQRGNFTAQDTVQTSFILQFYATGIWAYCCHHIIVRAFYSMKDTTTPLKVLSVTATLAILLNITLIWIPSIREGTFGLTTTIMAGLNVIILGTILSRRIGSLQFREIAISIFKTLIASGIMGLATYLSAAHLPIANKYLLLTVCLIVAVVVFFPACFVLRIEEAKEFLTFAGRQKSKTA